MKNTQMRRWGAVLLLLSALLCGPRAEAATVARPMVQVPGRTPANTAVVQSLASVPSSTTIPLAVVLPLQNPVGLQQTLQQLYDPASPQYHHFLTHAQFVASFSPSQSEYDSVVAYLQGQGLTVTNTYGNRLVVDVAGSAATIEKAFGVNLSTYASADGREVMLPDTSPSVPAYIAPMISSIAGLDTYAAPRPNLVARDALANAMAMPYGGSGPDGGLTPAQINGAYDLTSLSGHGSGQTLALFELDGYSQSDITQYENYFSLPNVTLQTKTYAGYSGAPSGTDGQAEVTLDIELMIAAAPNVNKIIVYEGPNNYTGLIDCYEAIADDDLAQSASSSWGLAEDETGGTSYVDPENSIFQEMATQGQSMYAASGDSGAYADGENIGVGDPASQPYVCGVGGTTLSVSGDAYGGEVTWQDSGGGVSTLWTKPSWQAGYGHSSTMRNVPDVSLDANPNTGYSIYVGGGWQVYGGTSCAAPLWAAFTALVNESRAGNDLGALGFPNPTLYQIGASNSYDTDFHDITSGNNYIYSAGTGYDDVTGWGSFDGASLLATLATSSGSGSPSPPVAPGNPASLSASADATSGSTEIDLSWSSASNAASYKILRSLKSGGPYSSVGTSNETTYTDAGLLAATSYYYVVQAVNGSLTSSDSNQASAMTKTSAPTGLRAAAGANSTVALTWNAVTGATSYVVERSETSGSGYQTIGTSRTPSYADSESGGGGATFYYVVAGVDAGGTSAVSNQASMATVPSAPSDLTATSAGASEIDLSWNASNGATSYLVYRSTSASTGFARYAEVGGVTTYSDEHALSATTYYYYVTAVDSGGTSASSNVASASTLAGAPTGLRAEAEGSSEIELTWTAVKGATEYLILSGTTSGGPYTQVGTSSTPSFANGGLTAATTYYYVVEAVDGGGAGAESSQVSASTTPAAPTGLAVTGVTGTSVSLSWNASTGAAGYTVYRGSSSGGPFTRISSVGSTAYTSSGLSADTTYYFTVSAVDAGGASAESSAVSATTLAGTPTGVRATALSGTSIEITWTAARGASSYVVLDSTTSGGSYNQAGTSNATSCTVTGLTSATTYYFVVEGIDPGGASPYSSQVSATTLPGAPTNLQASVAGSSEIDLTWTASTGASAYYVYRAASAYGPYVRVGSSSGASYTSGGLTAGTTYYFEVAGVDSGGTSDVSATTLPATPTDLRAVASGSTTVNLSWFAAKGATQYSVQMSTVQGGSYSQIGSTSAVTYTATGLTPGTTYYFVIVATGAGGSSADSNAASATTGPAAPSGLTAIAASSAEIDLSWNGSAGATSYTIWRSTKSTGEFARLSSTSATTFDSTGLSADSTYYYYVTASGSNLISAACSVASATTEEPAVKGR